jgi:hypothetical protein
VSQEHTIGVVCLPQTLAAVVEGCNGRLLDTVEDDDRLELTLADAASGSSDRPILVDVSGKRHISPANPVTARRKGPFSTGRIAFICNASSKTRGNTMLQQSD